MRAAPSGPTRIKARPAPGRAAVAQERKSHKAKHPSTKRPPMVPAVETGNARTREPLRDALSGLAPARAASCPRCGMPTIAFANGRTRLDICQACGTAEATTAEGLELFRMRDLTLK